MVGRKGYEQFPGQRTGNVYGFMHGFSPSREQAGVNMAFIVRGILIRFSFPIYFLLFVHLSVLPARLSLALSSPASPATAMTRISKFSRPFTGTLYVNCGNSFLGDN
ncbi:hypothetical protein E2C01_082013 [Portunus trituberculatus]|uniref:Uncharacterized protein n=1 Tax=Portunus trituberculatus TaxID=210409 RepID=A0A5B7INV7_PORTR|nr:hypothetical protein [Portunus trituberculatus]